MTHIYQVVVRVAYEGDTNLGFYTSYFDAMAAAKPIKQSGEYWYGEVLVKEWPVDNGERMPLEVYEVS